MLAETNASTRLPWSRDIEWLLCASGAALGEAGTLAAVVAAIERGASSTSDPDYHGRAIARSGAAPRARRLLGIWNRLPERERGAHTAYYVGVTSAPSRVKARFGELAGVVVALWCKSTTTRQRRVGAAAVSVVEARLRAVLAQLEPIERRLQWASAYGRAMTEVGYLSCDLDSRHWAFQAGAAAHFLEVAARPLRSARDGALAEMAEALMGGDRERDVAALVAACERGEPPGLRERAERAVRAAHDAWRAAGVNAEAAELG